MAAAYGWFSSSTPVIVFVQEEDLTPSLTANSDNGGGNSGGNSGSSDSGSSNSGGGNSGGNSGSSDSGSSNSGGGNSGGNSGSSNSGGGNSGGNSGSSDSGSSNSGGGNSGGNSGSSDSGSSNSGGGNSGGNSGNSNTDGNSRTDNGKSDTGTGTTAVKTGGATDKGNSGTDATPGTKTDADKGTPISISSSQITRRENAKELTIDTVKAKDSGEKITVEGSTITFSKGPMSIGVITAANPKETNGVITADIKSISMEHQPLTAHIKETGSVSASFKADLMSLPPSDATITAVITEQPGPATQVAIDQAVSDKGYQLDAVAYTMDVAKTNLNDGIDIGQATVTMSVSPLWVAAHGGVAGINIARFADDGTSQLLETRYVGLDSSANQVFEGTSPGGLSIFALISVKVPSEVIALQSQPASGASEPVPYGGALRTMGLAIPLVILGIILLIRRK